MNLNKYCVNTLLLQRRSLLRWMGVLGVSALAPVSMVAFADRLFSFEWLKTQAKTRAQHPFKPTPIRYSKQLEKIDYDKYQQIRFRGNHALWANTPNHYAVEMFHLGRYAQQPVTINKIVDGESETVNYSSRQFDYGDSGLNDLPKDLGFAGFRVMNPADTAGDWLAFLGASYFRSAGPLNQYGLSARGLAVDTAVTGVSEEFPRFTSFWIEQLLDEGIVIYALLDGPRVTGAYRFICHRTNTVTMDVSATLFQRGDISQLGIAPLTSMYWYSELNRRVGSDWRPEIHDSDGLAIWKGNGERIWRPLNNPRSLQFSSFSDDNPRGFGLLQRDRHFDHYQDDSVYYDRRPGVWIEPLGQWGQGAVCLVEIPTNDEIHDNVVAFWQPARPALKGSEWQLDYRLHWVDDEPYPPSLAKVVATRIGRPGVAGQHEPRQENGRKLVIDFSGGPLRELKQRFDVEVVAETSHGYIQNAYALKVLGTDYWRAAFDLYVDGDEPVELRCFLKLQDQTLTESWLYQYHPEQYGLGSVT